MLTSNVQLGYILTRGGGQAVKKILLCDVNYYLQHYNNYMQFLSYNYVNLNDNF